MQQQDYFGTRSGLLLIFPNLTQTNLFDRKKKQFQF